MGLTIFFISMVLCGIFLVLFGMFGKKRDINTLYLGGSSSIFEFIFELIFSLSGIIVKRIMICLLGAIWAIFFICMILFK